MNFQKQASRTTLVVLLLLLSAIGSAWGHAAIVWAYVENNMVYVEAFFPSGAKIQNATVLVIDAKGETLLEGKTDTEGKFSYKPTNRKSQTILIKAGESHVGDFELTDEDMAAIAPQ